MHKLINAMTRPTVIITGLLLALLAGCAAGSTVNIEQTCGASQIGTICEGTIIRLDAPYTLHLGQRNALNGAFLLDMQIGVAAGQVNVIVETADGRRLEQQMSPGNPVNIREILNAENGQAVVLLQPITADARSIGFNATLTR